MSIKFFCFSALVGVVFSEAIATPQGFPGQPHNSQCPAIWNQISTELTPIFLGSDGQCTDLARAAIRFAFHDSGKLPSVDHPIIRLLMYACVGTYSSTLPPYAPASGGADGSLLLSSDEIFRQENAALIPYHDWLSGYFGQYKDQVSAADLIQFAASHATVTCPGGPKVKTVGE